jgi:hypothetical protein
MTVVNGVMSASNDTTMAMVMGVVVKTLVAVDFHI